MVNVNFISESKLKQFSLLDDNTSMNYINPSLKFVQDKYMSNILGKELYFEIAEQIKNDNLTTANDKLLNDYIHNVLLWALMAEIQIPLNFKFRNQGYVENNNEDGSNAHLNEIKYTKQFYQNTAQFYMAELEEFLINNRKDYPTAKCNRSGGGSRQWNCPIIL